MALNDWKKQKTRSPYEHGKWINTKKGHLLTIISDVGFGEQRNVVVENYRNQLWSGYETIKVGYFENISQSLKFAKKYMENN